MKNNNNKDDGSLFDISPNLRVGLASLVYLIILVIFFISSVLFGTGCPSHSTQAVTVKYGEIGYSFTRFYCYNPIKWFNPKTGSASTNQQDPNDIFLGIFIMAPGLTMMLAIAYTFFYGLIFLLGLLAGFKGNHRMLKTFHLWVFRAMWFNLLVLIINAFSWFFLIIREGQNDYKNNANWICASFNDINWNLCGYVSAQFAFFILFFIVSLIAYMVTNQYLSGPPGKKGKDEDRPLISE